MLYKIKKNALYQESIKIRVFPRKFFYRKNGYSSNNKIKKKKIIGTFLVIQCRGLVFFVYIVSRLNSTLGYYNNIYFKTYLNIMLIKCLLIQGFAPELFIRVMGFRC